MPKERLRIKHKMTLGLQLSLILSTETAYRNKQKNNKKQKLWERVTTLLDSTVQCSQTQNHKTYKTQKSMAHQRKIKIQQNLSLKNTIWQIY